MRVLILAPAYHPQMGGAETYARVLAEGLALAGDDVTVLTDGTRVDASSAVESGVRVERATGFAGALTDRSKLLWEQMAFALNPEALAVAARARPDVVVANSNDTAPLARMIGDSLGVPAVGSFHEQEPENGPLGRGRVRLVYERLGLDGFLAGSEFYAEKAIANGAPRHRVHLVPHGVDVEVFSPRALERDPDGAYRVTLSGRIAPRKQQHLMVEAVRRLRHDRERDVRLTIAGRAHSSNLDYADGLRDQISAAALDDVVVIREDLSLFDMPDVYRESDLVVQPSTAEGLGLAVLEAMACGRPVMVSDTTGLREIVQSVHHGVRLPPDDVDAWVEAVEFLLDNPTMAATLGRNGRDLVERRFTRRRMIEATRRRLQALCDSWVYERDAS